MISIRKSIDDLARLDKSETSQDLSPAVRECYLLAIQAISHYVVDVNPGLTADFREHLQKIEGITVGALTSEQIRSSQASLRGELREYRDKTAVLLKRLNKEVADATAAMSNFAESVAATGEHHEAEMISQLRNLETVAGSHDLEQMRIGIGAAIIGIKSSVDHTQRSNLVIVAQLQDEIRALHLQFEQERKALFTDQASGAWNRRKIDLHLDNLVRQNQPFCLLFVWIRNLRRIESQFTPSILAKGLEAMVRRFTTIAGDGSVIGRWSDDQFVAVLDMAPDYAVALSGEVARKLSGNYSVQEDGVAQSITLQALAGLLDHAADADSATFRQKLEQLSGLISGA